MSDYTPTTEAVRHGYAADHNGCGGLDLDALAEFDRWLATHDAELRADEREKAARRVLKASGTKGTTYGHDALVISLNTGREWGSPLRLMPVYAAMRAARGEPL